MTTKLRILLCAAALSISLPLFGQTGAAPPSKGKVVILENDRILEGDIERIGDQYRIRRTIGETWLPGAKVLQLCANLEEAYHFLRSQTNLDDADERLRLARWCHLHGLRPQALEEATVAVKLRPNHADSLCLMRALQRSLASPPPEPAPPKTEPETAALSNLSCNAAALSLFVVRVQPILMNTCAKCHATGKGGSFKLVRVFDDSGPGNRRTTQQNLLATLALIHRERPAESPLLKYAVTLHGNADQPPVKGKNTQIYRTLEEWITLALADVPSSNTGSVADIKTLTEPAPRKTTTPMVPAVASAPPGNGPSPAAGASGLVSGQVPPTTIQEPADAPKTPVEKPAAVEEFAQPMAAPAPNPPPAAPAGPADPFDPAIFNKQMHPPK